MSVSFVFHTVLICLDLNCFSWKDEKSSTEDTVQSNSPVGYSQCYFYREVHATNRSFCIAVEISRKLYCCADVSNTTAHRFAAGHMSQGLKHNRTMIADMPSFLLFREYVTIAD